MKVTSEERELLKRMDAGELDGMVGDMFQTDGGSTVWTIIKNGIPVRFKQGPGGKFFNGKENERYSRDGSSLEFTMMRASAELRWSIAKECSS